MKVTYDARCVRYDGVPQFLLSGSIHYPRTHPSRWASLFAALRDAGLNTVETYVFWGEHQRTPEPIYDWQGRRDLWGFIRAAAAAGLAVILRLGPYVCAEAHFGGLPAWLRAVPGLRFRTDNEPFMAAMGSWCRHVARELRCRCLSAADGGPVVAVQLENEYDMVADAYGPGGARYLDWVGRLGVELDVGVPLLMCLGAPDGPDVPVLSTINAFYGHEHVGAHRAAHPSSPPLWTEHWTGWYGVYGAAAGVGRRAADLAYGTARFVAAGGAGVNYYMAHGGSNWGRSGMYLASATYDYDAPLDEAGGAGDKAAHLAALHRVLAHAWVGPLFLGSAATPAVDGAPVGSGAGVSTYRWTAGAADVVFVCNDGDAAAAPPSADAVGGVALRPLAPRSVVLVDAAAGRVLFDTAAVPRLGALPDRAVLLGPPATAVDCGSSGGGGVVDLVSLTGDTSDYCWYVRSVDVPPPPPAVDGGGPAAADRLVATLTVTAADVVHAYVNGAYVGSSPPPGVPLWEDRFPNKWNAYPTGWPGWTHTVSFPWAPVAAAAAAATPAAGGGWRWPSWPPRRGWSRGTGSSGGGPICSTSARASCRRRRSACGRRRRTRRRRHGRRPWRRAPPRWGGGGGGRAGRPSPSSRGKSRASGTQSPTGGGSSASPSGLCRRHPPRRPPGGGVPPPTRLPTWHTATVTVAGGASDGWFLDLGGLSRGALYVNGHHLGRYWTVGGRRGLNGFLDGSPMGVGLAAAVVDVDGNGSGGSGDGGDRDRDGGDGDGGGKTADPPPPTQRWYHVPPWVVADGGAGGDGGGAGVALRVTLMDEGGGDPSAVALYDTAMREVGAPGGGRELRGAATGILAAATRQWDQCRQRGGGGPRSRQWGCRGSGTL
ncbi:hypothetical protein BU14_0153s0034 [Porphyra umbilicalis]|uniref:Beta-galactosidase n=1 Tax=Porphyra umbilicalis TaxID=2786 RepID=A0A1X6P8S1_PORUM|nr:hypothetical protein BU14_0153s0034 [Porphyra umbilicalis]|eukprot:OSX77292.1 hypothetical protein BU14_0153s0034 [Porphyra umbilicalis]